MDREKKVDQPVLDQTLSAAPEKTPVSTPQKTLAERVRDLFNQDGEARVIADAVTKDIDYARDTGRTYEEVTRDDVSTKKEKENELVGELKRIVNESKRLKSDPKMANLPENSFLPQFAWEIIHEVDEAGVRAQSIPILTALVSHSLDRHVETGDSMGTLIHKIYSLRFTDTELARKVLFSLKDKMIEKGWIEESFILEIDKFCNEYQVEQNSINLKTESNTDKGEELREIDRSERAIDRALKEIRLTNKGKAKAGAVADDQVSSENENAHMGLRAKIKEEAEKKLLIDAISRITPTYQRMKGYVESAEERKKLYQAFKESVQSLIEEEIVDGKSLETILREAEQVYKGLEQQDRLTVNHRRMIERITSGSLTNQQIEKEEQQMQHDFEYSLSHAGVRLSSEKSELYRSIYFVKDFPEYAKLHYVTGAGVDAVFDWDKFYLDTRDLLDEILEVAEIRPHEFFQNAVSNFYHGHLVDVLIDSISYLGKDISRKKENGSNLDLPDTVEITSILQTSLSQGDINLPAQIKAAFLNRREIPLQSAISNVLVQDMIDWYRGAEYLHNVNAVVQQGQGFEQLKNYTDNFSMKLLDKMFLTDSELSEVYNLYISNLQLELATNDRITPSYFGIEDDESRLDYVGTRTLYQLLAQKSTRNTSSVDMQNKYRRMIRRAQAIAKGVSGDFWTCALTARMPFTYEEYSVSGREDPMYKINRTYVGTGDSGVEKMMTSLDLYKTFERFGVPDWIKAVGYVFRPISLGHHDKVDLDFVHDHTNVFKFRRNVEHAIFAGQTEWQAEQDEKYVTWGEDMYADSVGLAVRGGWRYIEARVLEETGVGGIANFQVSIDRMMRVGTYLAKDYIDKLASREFKKIDLVYVEYRNNDGDIEKHFITDKERKEGLGDLTDKVKEYMYEKYVYGRIINIFPTVMVNMERRRYTPESEQLIKGFLAQNLAERLKDMGLAYEPQFINDKVNPIFSSAIHMIEQRVWQQRRTLWDNLSVKDTNLINYTLDESMVFTDENTEFLRAYYRQCRDQIGDSGKDGRLNNNMYLAPGNLKGLSEDDFIVLLRKYFTDLQGSLKAPRYRRNSHDRKYLLNGGLAQRYTKLLKNNIGRVGYDLGGIDFDFSSFLFQAGGKRAHARMFGETFGITEFNGALSELVNVALLDVASSNISGREKVHDIAVKQLAPILLKMRKPVADMSWDQAMGVMEKTIGYITQVFVKDRKYQQLGIGSYRQYFDKNVLNRKGNLASEYVLDKFKRPSTFWGLDDVATAVEALGDKVGLFFGEKETMDYVDRKLFGIFPIKVPDPKTMKHHPYNMERLEKATGLVFENKFNKLYAPIIFFSLFLIIGALAKFAGDANKKKH